MELDAAATVIFSATGIGGSSIALYGAGNIYVAGSTTRLDYPTTHVTLVWAIQDDRDDPDPIDATALIAALEEQRGSGPITLLAHQDVDTREHLQVRICR